MRCSPVRASRPRCAVASSRPPRATRSSSSRCSRWPARTTANGEVAVPPTIQALLAARLERLPAGERTTVELAVGRRQGVHARRGARAVLRRRAAVTADRVLALVRKELVRPSRVVEDAELYRFRHQLIRDAAYEAMSKEVRAALHERYADRLDEPWSAEARRARRDRRLPPRAGASVSSRAWRAPGESARPSAGAPPSASPRRASAPCLVATCHAARSCSSAQSHCSTGRTHANAELLCDLSIVLRDQGRFDEADATLTRVLDRSEADPAVRARAELLRTYLRTMKGGSQASALRTRSA